MVVVRSLQTRIVRWCCFCLTDGGVWVIIPVVAEGNSEAARGSSLFALQCDLPEGREKALGKVEVEGKDRSACAETVFFFAHPVLGSHQLGGHEDPVEQRVDQHGWIEPSASLVVVPQHHGQREQGR
jgi:hypothetical protein